MASKSSVSEVRAWAKEQGFVLADRGRLPAEVWAAWESHSKAAPKRATGSASASRPAAAPQVAADDLTVLADDLALTAEDVAALSGALAAAVARIEQLEQQVSHLSRDLSALRQQPRRRFARSRSVATSAG